jgi:hypothetical protein
LDHAKLLARQALPYAMLRIRQPSEAQMSGKDEPNPPRRWDRVKLESDITGDARWDLNEARISPRRGPELVLPIFVELLPKATQNFAGFIRFLSGAPDQYIIADHVMDRLLSEPDTDRTDGPYLISLASRPEAVATEFWRIISIGQPMVSNFRSERFADGPKRQVKTGRLSRTPVVGIIDDSIGFLHHRFRNAKGKTRFHRLWIMHKDMLAGNPAPCDPVPLLGIELSAAHINHRLALNQGETALYREVNNGVFGAAIRHGTAFHAGHGTHVLDLAAGAEAGDPMANVPILGVQLSPSSFGETSGAALDPDLMLGFEWIIEQAIAMKDRFPLVINLSLGALAGPLDGTGRVEQWMLAGMKRYDTATNHAPIRVVVAYGNAHRSRLVAEVTLAKGEDATLDWRILPDDATKSVLEIRSDFGLGTQLGFELTPPDAGGPLSLGAWPNGPVVHQYVVPTGVACEVLNEVEINPISGQNLRDKLRVTVAPTTRSDPRPLACSGAWKVKVSNTGPSDATISFKVQRDDTPGGYRRNGRQSWLDHPTAWDWEPLVRANAMPGTASPIRRENTEVSYAGFEHGSTYFVGAMRPNPVATGPTAPNAFRPSLYSAEGALPKPDAPTLAAQGDEGAALIGVRAAGVISGSTTRMSGTSMAAPIITRRLLEYAMTGQMAANLSGATNQAEVQFVLKQPAAPAQDARLGWEVALPT